MSKIPKRGIWLAVSLICLMLFGRRTHALETSGDKIIEVFSEHEGFYQEDVQVELAIPGMTEIYYREEGQAPGR